ncbi:MAG: hypothetical protein ACJ74H_12175 [Thermoanaerobaculia bacterium]
MSCSTVGNVQYRTDSIPAKAAPGQAPAERPQTTIEITDAYALGIVEFDDQGRYWNRNAAEDVLRHINRAGIYDPVNVVVYIHGWKHNATSCDQNLVCFRETLRYLSLRGGSQKVIGVYVGWRGALTHASVLKEFTFWNRKAAAHRIGRGDLVEFLARLDALNTRMNTRHSRLRENSLVLIGHSLGAAMLYSSIQQILIARTVAEVLPVQPEGHSFSRIFGRQPLTGFGDLVVLVNPAFEAGLYGGLREFWTANSYENPPVLLTISSTGDFANTNIFPVGRGIAAVFESFRDDEQKRQYTTSIGNYLPFVDFTIEQRCGTMTLTSAPEQEQKCSCSWRLDPKNVQTVEALPGTQQACVGGYALPDDAFRTPFVNIRAPKELITGHNGIFRSELTEFLIAFAARTRDEQQENARFMSPRLSVGMFPPERFDQVARKMTLGMTDVIVRRAEAKDKKGNGLRCAIELSMGAGLLSHRQRLNAPSRSSAPSGVARPSGEAAVPNYEALVVIENGAGQTFLFPRDGVPFSLPGHRYYVDRDRNLLIAYASPSSTGPGPRVVVFDYERGIRLVEVGTISPRNLYRDESGYFITGDQYEGRNRIEEGLAFRLDYEAGTAEPMSMPSDHETKLVRPTFDGDSVPPCTIPDA